MDKKTFLEELRKSLRVLKEEELQDIIGEYEQHIDIKVQKGLTVEQAIADFGNIKELAAEILEAYHVRAEFSFSEESNSANNLENKHSDANEDRSAVSENASAGDSSKPESDDAAKTNILKDSAKLFCLGSKWILAKLRRGLTMIWSIIVWCGGQMVRPMHWGKGWFNKKKEERIQKMSQDSSGNQNMHTENEEIPRSGNTHTSKSTGDQVNGFLRQTIRRVTNMLHITFHWILEFTIFCLRIFWNCFAIGTALFIGALGLCCLFLTGVLGVLLFQGYPLTGLTVGCVGIVLCLFAGAALAWTLIWHKNQNEESIKESAEFQHVKAGEMEVSQNA